MVEAMDEREVTRREESLRSSLGRLAAARSLRVGDIPVLVHPYDLAHDDTPQPRRGMFRFAERARRAVGAGSDD
jgi:hypothetical protein